MTKWLLFIIGILCQHICLADNYLITTPSEEYKLSDNLVHSIYKDSDGFIWFGTGTTIERFDGMTGETYLFEMPNKGYASLIVNAITERTRHEYWVGNQFGLWRLDHQTKRAIRMFASQINTPVNALTKDSAHNLYIGTTNGLYVNDNGRLHKISAENAGQLLDISGLATTPQRDVCVLTKDGVSIVKYQSNKVKYYPNTLMGTGKLQTFTYADNRLYIGTETGEILTFDFSTYRFERFWRGVNAPVSALSYERGTLAIGTTGKGIVLLSTSNKQIRYALSKEAPFGEELLSNYISCILLSDNKVWCGMDYYLGFNLLRNLSYPSHLYTNGTFTTKDMSVRSCFYKDSCMYIGTREGLYVSDERTQQTTHYSPSNNGIRSNLIFAIDAYKNLIYIGTCKGGLSIYDPHNKTFIHNELTQELANTDIFMFTEDKQGRLWIATLDGLFSYDGHTIRGYNVINSELPGDIVYSLYIDQSGHFWVGTEKGAVQFNPDNGKSKPATTIPHSPINNTPVRYITKGQDGKMFFFLRDNNQLQVLDLAKQTVQSYPDFHCFNMIIDSIGNYWLGSDNGLIKGNRRFTQFTEYGLSEVINADMGCSPGSFLKPYHTGEYAIPCTKGLVISRLEEMYPMAPYRITELVVNGKPRMNFYQLFGNKPISLKYDENDITFRFMSLNYENPELSNSEYMLEGVDSTWNSLQGENKVSYYNLPAGHYTFKVRRRLDEHSMCQISFSIGHDWSYAIGAIGGVLLICMILGGYLRRHDIKRLLEKRFLPSTTSQALSPDRAEYANVKENELKSLAAELDAYMQKEKPYLNKELKQSDVAQTLKCSTYTLSALFTVYLKTNYYDYINHFRIEEFKEVIKQADCQRYTILTLAERCGFSSKSSFFRIFKKQTSMTPNEYIQHEKDTKEA